MFHPLAALLLVTAGILGARAFPAWGATHDDNAIGNAVAFQWQMPDLTASEYEVMVREAEQHTGHEH